jgi:predicted DNA binding CopG/RHH family protein
MVNYTKEEKELLQDIENGDYKSINNVQEELLSVKNAAKNTTAKTKNINIRVTQADIMRLKSKSIEVGIPYQTIVNALIHNYATGKLKLTI